ncbi:MAG: aspartyl/glutamyl-tRNA amidotransferase subunit B [Parcubacteria group bacterium GW2011_GWA2_47_26]|nr:MAG: aspartyl/glutamyl-tRNA amidotransferase subunit B [Parcubacteria group bacterium GW2011_GWA2_47_26]
MQYQPIIGLEIHVQLKTKSKLFCGCDNRGEDAPPNTTVCPICMGHPGVLPVLNKQALDWGVLAGLALNCAIPEKAKFDRKNYFYPDLPKAYQISMYDEPIAINGLLPLEIPAPKGDRRYADIRITRIHLEEDAAKMIHNSTSPPLNLRGGREGLPPERSAAKLNGLRSYVDFNRAGTPLIEIVTEPDLRSPLEAKTFLQELRRIMRYLNVSDADMEKGHLRCDANISLQPILATPDLPSYVRGGTGGLHPKTELKNINSFRAVERALQYEIQRQTKLWEADASPKIPTTRGWNEKEGVTEEQRSKEGSEDYRYFREPDLPPLLLHEIAKEVRGKMPELPRAKRIRFQEEYSFSASDALTLTEEKLVADYVEKTMMELRTWIIAAEEEGAEDEKWGRNKQKLVRLFSGWFLSKLFGLMEKHAVDIRLLKITPENFAEFLTMIHANRVSSAAGLQVLEEMLLTGADPHHIVEEKKLEQVSNEEEIATIVQNAIEANPQPVADFKAGKQNALQFLVGQVMKTSRGKANPDLAQKLLRKLLRPLAK